MLIMETWRAIRSLLILVKSRHCLGRGLIGLQFSFHVSGDRSVCSWRDALITTTIFGRHQRRHWIVLLHATCNSFADAEWEPRLRSCKPGSTPCPTLVIKYGIILLFFTYFHNIFDYIQKSAAYGAKASNFWLLLHKQLIFQISWWRWW